MTSKYNHRLYAKASHIKKSVVLEYTVCWDPERKQTLSRALGAGDVASGVYWN